MTFTKQRVSLVEYGVFKYPKGLEGWRCYRIEYGGHAQDCILEGSIWLPPNIRSRDLEEYIQGFADKGGPDTRYPNDAYDDEE